MLQAQSPRMKEPLEAAASQPEQQRKPPLKRAAAEKADKPSKKGSLKPLDTDDAPLLATSPANEQALSAGAVKPETPAKVSKPGCLPSIESACRSSAEQRTTLRQPTVNTTRNACYGILTVLSHHCVFLSTVCRARPMDECMLLFGLWPMESVRIGYSTSLCFQTRKRIRSHCP